MGLKEKAERLLAGGRKYSYTPDTLRSQIDRFVKNNSRPVAMALISVFLIAGFYNFSDEITGYLTYQSNLELQLNETKNMLSSAEAEKSSCTSDLASANDDLDECRSSVSSSESSLSKCIKEKNSMADVSNALSASLETCEAENNDIEGKLKSKTDSYDALVRNSARSICCRTFDVIEGAVVKWDLKDSRIACGDGRYSMNCTSGSTNY